MRKERISDEIMRLNFYSHNNDNAYINQYFDSGRSLYYLSNNIFFRSADEPCVASPQYAYIGGELSYYGYKYGIYKNLLKVFNKNNKIK